MTYNSASPAGAEVVLKSSCWSTIWWIFSSLPLVLAAPYVICKAMCHLKINKNRDTLPGKVILSPQISIQKRSVIIDFSRTFTYTGGCHNGSQFWFGRGSGALILSSRLQSRACRTQRRGVRTRSYRFVGNSFGKHICI